MPAILDFDFARPASYDPTDMVGVACVRSLASSAHPGTYVGQDGLIKLAPHNLLLQSEDFSTTWVRLRVLAWGSGSTVNSATSPDGTMTADLVAEDTANDTHFMRQSVTVSSGVQHTFSVFAKAGVRSFLVLAESAGNIRSACFNLSNGAVSNVGTNVTANSEYKGNGWYRCWITYTTVSTTFQCDAGFRTSAGVGLETYTGTNGTFYLWGAQLNLGPTALDYTKTTSAANGGTRIGWGPREPYQNLLLQTTLPGGGSPPTGWTVGSGSGSASSSCWGSDASAYTFTSSASRNWFYQNFTTVSNTTYSFSVKLETTTGAVALNDIIQPTSLPAGCTITAYQFDGVTQSASYTPAVAGIVSCTIGGTYTGGAVVFRIGCGTGANTTGTVKLSRPNLNVGAQAYSWYPTTSTAVYTTPFDLVNNWECHGAMSEGTQQDLLVYTEQFDNGNWPKTRATVTADAILAPDGTMTGDKLVEDSGGSDHYLQQSPSKAASAIDYVFTGHLKAGERTKAYIVCYGSSFSNRADLQVDLVTGELTAPAAAAGTFAGASARVTMRANGWLRIQLRFTSDTHTAISCRFCLVNGTTSYTGDGTSGFYIWGANLVPASVDGSYLPAVASTVTRNADAISYTLSGAHATALSTAGTVVVEYRLSGGVPESGGADRKAMSLDDGTSSNRIWSGTSVGLNATRAIITTGGVGQAANNNAVGLAVGSRIVSAFSYTTNNANLATNGIPVDNDASCTIPAVTRLGFGAASAGGNELFGTVKRVTIFSTALTNTQTTNASLPVAPTAHWRTLDGTHRMASDTDKTVSCDIEGEANPNTAGENGIQRVEFYVSVNGVLSSIATQTARSERTHNSTPLGANTRRKLWSYGITVDLSALAGGTVTVDASVFSNLGAIEYLPTLTLYNDTDGNDRRPNSSVVYYDYDLGDDTTGTGTIGNPVKNLRAAMALLSGDVGGAKIIALGRTVGCTPSSSYSAPGWYTSGKWALTVQATGTDKTFRRLSMGTFSDPQDYILGTGGAVLVTMRWVDFEFVGPGPAIYLSGPNARVDEINCTHRSNKYQDTDLIPHVDYEQYGSGGVGFELHGVSQARIYGWGGRWKGVGRGPQGYSGLFNFTIDKFLGIALGTSNDYGNNPCYTHGDIDDIRYLPVLLDGLIQTNLNFTQLAGVHVTVSIQATGPHTGKMRIDATDSTPNDFGAGAAALVGSTRWGVTISSATSGANNGTFAALEGGLNGSSRPYCILDNASAVAEVGSAGFDMMTGTLVGGFRYIDVVHTDILQQSAPHVGAMFAHIRAYDCQNSRSWVGSGLAFERCVYKNLTDGSHSSVNGTAWDWGSGEVIAKNCIFSFISLNGRANSFAGSWTGTSFVDVVVGDGSQFPTVGVFTHSCHFITGATSGTNPSSGAWFAGEPGNSPFDFTPSTGNLGTASGLQDAPTFWRHTGAVADSRGAWRNIANGNWSTAPSGSGGRSTVGIPYLGLGVRVGFL